MATNLPEVAPEQCPAVAVAEPTFEVQNEEVLKVRIGGDTLGATGTPLNSVWIKRGTMVSHTGTEVKLKRESILEHGYIYAVKNLISSKPMALVRASLKPSSKPDCNAAILLLAHRGKQVVVQRLAGNSIVVQAKNLLAFEPDRIKPTVRMMCRFSGVVWGRVFNVELQGHGHVAILVDGRAVTIPVKSKRPAVYTNPQATVAWSGSLVPSLHPDVNLKTFCCRSSGQSLQMKFVADKVPGDRYDDAFVMVQSEAQDRFPTALKFVKSTVKLALKACCLN